MHARSPALQISTGEGERLDAESLELLAAEGRKGNRAGKGGWRALYLGVSFQHQESLHACSLLCSPPISPPKRRLVFSSDCPCTCCRNSQGPGCGGC